MVALVAAAVIVGQLVTGQRAVIEPRDRRLPLSSNAEATRLLVRACGNCHSNHTDWPWYSHVELRAAAAYVTTGASQYRFSGTC
jgi:hypothetical protein